MPQAFPLAFSRPWPAARMPRLSSSKARFLLNSLRWKPRLLIKRALSAKLSSWRNESANHTQPGIPPCNGAQHSPASSSLRI